MKPISEELAALRAMNVAELVERYIEDGLARLEGPRGHCEGGRGRLGARGLDLPQPQRGGQACHRQPLEREALLRAHAEGAVIATKVLVVRVAVYTRKSVTEGLEQEFNSLDARARRPSTT